MRPRAPPALPPLWTESMQAAGTSSTIGGSSESHGVAFSSDGPFETDIISDGPVQMDREEIDLNAVQPDLEQDGSSEILVVNKKLRSRVWNDFVLTQVDGGTYKATCKHCKHAYVAGNRSGTSHLKYHLGVCPKILSSRKRKSPRSDIPIFDQQRSRDDFSRMVLGHGYPFNMAEHYYTRTFIYNLQPSFKLVHRTALKDDCMKIYDEERLRMYQLFDKQPGRFSITSDMWTHIEISGYMSMTAHYIDDSWKLHSSLIGFAYVEIPHNGEHIGKEIISRLYPWNLDRKLFSFSLDNCKVNNVVIRDLKRLYDEFVADLRVKAAKKAFSDLFGEYAIESPQASSNASTSRTNEVEIASSQEPSSSLFATRLGLEKFIYESNSTQNKKSELEVYLEDPLCPEISNNSFDILAWWRINGLKYPILSRMARDVLSVPVSTVASESAFSCAKRILDEYRCNLLPETIEAIMCSHDWLKSRIPVESTATEESEVMSDSSLLPATCMEGQSVDDYTDD